MGQYLLDHHRIFDTGNDLDGATAFATRLDASPEHYLFITCLPFYLFPAQKCMSDFPCIAAVQDFWLNGNSGSFPDI